jgi:hypothetical protein
MENRDIENEGLTCVNLERQKTITTKAGKLHMRVSELFPLGFWSRVQKNRKGRKEEWSLSLHQHLRTEKASNLGLRKLAMEKAREGSGRI